MTSCNAAPETPTSAWIAGPATLTIAVSSDAMNVPASRTARAARLGVLEGAVMTSASRQRRGAATPSEVIPRPPEGSDPFICAQQSLSGRERGVCPGRGQTPSCGANNRCWIGSKAMRAATVRDGEIVVEDHPDPTPGHGEVLIRVRAAALNGADMMQKRGLYPAPAGWPQDIPGLDVAGEVAATGPDATRFQPGDRVMGFVGGGGQGELLCAHERLLMPVPDGVDWPQAGGIPEVFTTAHDALFTQAGLRAGERLLVHGAAGGVGTAGVQLGAAAGAQVTATVRNSDHREALAELGAHQVVEPEGFAEH